MPPSRDDSPSAPRASASAPPPAASPPFERSGAPHLSLRRSSASSVEARRKSYLLRAAEEAAASPPPAAPPPLPSSLSSYSRTEVARRVSLAHLRAWPVQPKRTFGVPAKSVLFALRLRRRSEVRREEETLRKYLAMANARQRMSIARDGKGRRGAIDLGLLEALSYPDPPVQGALAFATKEARKPDARELEEKLDELEKRLSSDLRLREGAPPHCEPTADAVREASNPNAREFAEKSDQQQAKQSRDVHVPDDAPPAQPSPRKSRLMFNRKRRGRSLDASPVQR
ncbi:hypothetical protein AB1Y20_002584 [Prymnesium parvum]|uniref:Uncharacterized protein n=1 Tax=Prymnesium parvum TaxID=97485 RepID=A0AB34J9H1_PRYPA